VGFGKMTYVSGTDRQAEMEAIARLLARLAHRFADREAILWRAGYDEDSWSKLEERALVALQADVEAGDGKTARAFARELIRARLELVAPGVLQTTEDGVSLQPGSEEAVPTVPGYARISSAGREPPATASDATLLQKMSALIDAYPGDPDPLSVTLTSSKDARKLGR